MRLLSSESSASNCRNLLWLSSISALSCDSSVLGTCSPVWGTLGDSSFAGGALVEVTGEGWASGDVAESVEGFVKVVAGALCTGEVLEELLLFATATMMNTTKSATSPNTAFLPAGVRPVVETGIGGLPGEDCCGATLFLGEGGGACVRLAARCPATLRVSVS